MKPGKYKRWFMLEGPWLCSVLNVLCSYTMHETHNVHVHIISSTEMFPFSKFLSLKSTTTMYMTVCFLHSQLTKKVNKNIQQRTLSSFILTISLLPNNNYRYVKKPLIYGIQFSTAFQIMPPPRPKWKLLLTKERKGANKHNNNQPAFSFLSNVFFHHSPNWFLKRSIYWDTQEISKE